MVRVLLNICNIFTGGYDYEVWKISYDEIRFW